MKTILIVDDEFGLAEALCAILTLSGYRADKAWHGQLALKKVAEQRPDMIVSDLMMPIMDGYELLRALKANPDWRSIPVVLMSAGAPPEPDKAAEAVGFLTKPFDIGALLDLVRQQIGPPDASPTPAKR